MDLPSTSTSPRATPGETSRSLPITYITVADIEKPTVNWWFKLRVGLLAGAVFYLGQRAIIWLYAHVAL